MPEKKCKNAKNHMLGPSGYIAWHEWAKRMARTHKQRKCQDCGLWMLWIPKKHKMPDVVISARAL